MSTKTTDSRELAKDLIRDAVSDASKSAALLQNPAGYFRKGGIELPPAQDQEFNRYFLQGKLALTNLLSLHSKAGQLSADAQNQLVSLALPSFECCACSVGVWSVAVAVVAVGVVGLAGLTIEAPAVVALAAFAGVSAQTALVFLGTLGAIVTGGPSAVADAICRWTGACK